MTREFALCPECDEWSEVAFTDELPPGGWWWKDSAGCPRCDATICVESECTFGKVVRQLDRGRVVIVSGPWCQSCRPGGPFAIDQMGKYSRTLRGIHTGRRCALCDTIIALVSPRACYAPGAT